MDETSRNKPKWISNPDLVKLVRNQRCTICSFWPSDAHHVSSKSTHGDDTGDNLMPLCREHHTLWHDKGIGFMIQNFKKISDWFICHDRLDVVFDPYSRTDFTDQCVDKIRCKISKSRR